MSLALNRCGDKVSWDQFVKASPQSNVFCLTPFLDSLGTDYELLFVEKGGQIKLGAIILRGPDGPIYAPHPLTMYQGLLFDHSFIGMPSHRRVHEALILVGFLLAELERRHARISFCLHPAFDDLRGFLWFHYHEPQFGQFKIDLRYSGILDFSRYPSFEDYLSSIRSVRRSEFRRTTAAGMTVEVSEDLDLLDRLYRMTFERQNAAVSPSQLEMVRAVSQAALDNDFGTMLIAKERNGNVASATVFLYDNRCAYYLIGANDPTYRASGAGPFLVLENLRLFKKKGLQWVDFVGINSPTRGDFKTSFNAAPVPYFIVTWERQHSDS